MGKKMNAENEPIKKGRFGIYFKPEGSAYCPKCYCVFSVKNTECINCGQKFLVDEHTWGKGNKSGS